MRKLFSTAVLAVFFSLYLSGCYTQFGKPEPETGARQTYNDYTYDDYYWGYLSPGFFGYPYYTYGFFYSPWWYDQIYYYYTDDNNSSNSKFVRSRYHNNPLPPPPSSGGILPPSNTPSTGEVKIRSGNDSRQSGEESGPEKKEKSEGKSTRRRR